MSVYWSEFHSNNLYKPRDYTPCPHGTLDHHKHCDMLNTHAGVETVNGQRVKTDDKALKTELTLKNAGARRLMWTRSTPGLSVALVGHKSHPNVAANLEVAKYPPLSPVAHSAITQKCTKTPDSEWRPLKQW